MSSMEGKQNLIICLDLAEAFDTVAFSIVSARLEEGCVRDLFLLLFKYYLRSWRQRVKSGQITRDLLTISYGVPQDSVLTPILFPVYINELCRMKMTQGKFFAFADDLLFVFFTFLLFYVGPPTYCMVLHCVDNVSACLKIKYWR